MRLIHLPKDIKESIATFLPILAKMSLALASNATPRIDEPLSYMTRLMKRHFPEAPTPFTYNQFKQSVTVNYDGLSKRKRELFIAVKDLDLDHLEQLNVKILDLYQIDKKNCTVLQWIQKSNSLALMDYVYQHIILREIDSIHRVDHSPYQNTLLHWVILLRQSSTVLRGVINDGADVNARRTDTATPLFLAIVERNFPAVEVLITKPTLKVNQTVEPFGAAALHLACQYGENRMVRLLLGHSNIAVNSVAKNGYTPLMTATRAKKTSTLAILCAQDGILLDSRDRDGNTALWMAAYMGYEEAVKLLLMYDANVDRPNRQGVTPLCIACRNGHMSILRELIRKNANINHQLVDGRTPLMIALLSNQPDLAEFLLNSSQLDASLGIVDGVTPLHVAVEKRYTQCVEKIIMRDNVNVNVITASGVTPLMKAAQQGFTKILNLLRDYPKIEINKQNRDSVNALLIATSHQHLEGVESLLYHSGINPNVITTKGNTPLHIATAQGNLKIVIELLSHPMTSSKKINLAGFLPIEIAKRKGYLEIIKVLECHQLLSTIEDDINHHTDLTAHIGLFRSNMATQTLDQIDQLVDELEHSKISHPS